MSSQKHMCMRVFAIAFVSISVDAMRVQPARVAAKKETIGNQMEKLIDVTSLLDTDEFKHSGFDCCCDKRKEGEAGKADDERGIDSAERANYCAIAYLWPVWKCGGVKVANNTEMAHNYKSTGGKCEIMRDNVPKIVDALKKPDYCPMNKYEFSSEAGTMEVNIPSAALGVTHTAPCPDGTEGKVTCQVGTLTIGYWGAVKCGDKPTWCPATPTSDEKDFGAPGLSAGMMEEEHYVNCYETTPSTGTTRCTAKGWIPQGGTTGWDKDGLPPVCLANE